MMEENQTNSGPHNQSDQDASYQPKENSVLEEDTIVSNDSEQPEVAPEQVQPVVEATTQAPVSIGDKKDADTKLFAAMSYFSALFVVPLVTKKDNKYVAFHVKQGMALFIAELVAWFVLWMIEAFLEGIFSYNAIGFTQFLYKLAWLVFGAASVLGIYNAVTGKEKPLPYLSIITKNIKL